MSSARPFDRRLFLRGAGVAAAAAAMVPVLSFQEWAEAATAEAQQHVFGYGVASGDPTADAVILWTRVNPSPDAVPGSGLGGPVTVTWEMAADEAFTGVLRSGTVVTDATRDHTVKVDVTGLAIYTRYYFRFRALGATSDVGRTQTAPDEPGVVHALRFAFASCANYTGGYFTPYRDMAARDDLDFVLFLGDYIYEYGNGSDRYGPSELAGVRDHEPAYEPLSLADYRLRHAIYKADPDLQAAHRRHPWIAIFDDHEVCDNTYDTGRRQPPAGHRGSVPRAPRPGLPGVPGVDADPAARPDRCRRHPVLAALPLRRPGRPLGGRDAPAPQPSRPPSPTPPRIADPARQLPERQQRQWLTDGITGSAKPWHLVGNQVVIAPVRLPSTPAVLSDARAARHRRRAGVQHRPVGRLPGRPAGRARRDGRPRPRRRWCSPATSTPRGRTTCRRSPPPRRTPRRPRAPRRCPPSAPSTSARR